MCLSAVVDARVSSNGHFSGTWHKFTSCTATHEEESSKTASKNSTEQKHEIWISLTLFLMVISSQSLQRELQGHRGRVEDVLERAGVIASIRSPEADSIRAGMEQLHQLWEVLWTETEHRQLRLDVMYQAQQYYFDAGEVEAWLSEQELHMMNEEKGKVGEESRQKHQTAILG